MDDKLFLEELSKHSRMEKILSVAVDINDSIDLADIAEERLIEEGRILIERHQKHGRTGNSV